MIGVKSLALLAFVGFSAKDRHPPFIPRQEMLDSSRHPTLIFNLSRDPRVHPLMNPTIIGWWLLLGCPKVFKMWEQRHFHHLR